MIKKSIPFTDAEYKTLMKLVFIGDWVLNAHVIEGKHDDVHELLQKVLSYHKLFNATELIDDFDDMYELKEDNVMEIIEEMKDYDEDVFWRSLVTKLAKRDLLELFHSGKLNENDDQRDLLDKFEYSYKKEFDKNGLEHLKIVKDSEVDPSLN